MDINPIFCNFSGGEHKSSDVGFDLYVPKIRAPKGIRGLPRIAPPVPVIVDKAKLGQLARAAPPKPV